MREIVGNIMRKVAFTIGYLRKAGPYLDALRAVGLDVEPFTPENPPPSLIPYAGLVLGGGGDIDPKYYGEPNHQAQDPHRERDEMELALFKQARERGMPVLGICRGLQLINVGYGGTLAQHIGDAHRGDTHLGGTSKHATHTVSVEDGTLLRSVVGSAHFEVVSRHHQAIKILGLGLRVCATSADGVIEAVEDPTHPFLLGVQWHPEENSRIPEETALLRGFARAAGVRG
jgi:putative glutamine amidotransferase